MDESEYDLLVERCNELDVALTIAVETAFNMYGFPKEGSVERIIAMRGIFRASARDRIKAKALKET